jgi:hypothetical protein
MKNKNPATMGGALQENLLFLADVFLWILVKLALAAGCAEIVRLALIFRLGWRGLFIYIHTADWILCHQDHLLSMTYET